ncbi:PilW family protein [Halomonas sp.]|uniref:PilW family protein n=1 Tax=Halomonas sp. TaxID=1486246 RepID=UPI00298E0379|nr:prepilin-type N-terminal cleavage/methylation domain-containing protein [Halomonas sp.]MDW7746181.1 prepilin-type N-terminal cleavage/methylation domain-containing protein [Halomonas sp.]
MRNNNLCQFGAKDKGFSLVELMVALLIGLIVLLGAGKVFITGLQSFQRMEALAKRQEILRYVVDVMSDDVRSAFNASSQNPNTASTEVRVVDSGSAVEIEYFDALSLRGREGIPYCKNSTSADEIAPFIDGVDDVYNVRYEFDDAAGELKVSYRCGWLEADGIAPDPEQEFEIYPSGVTHSGVTYSAPSAVAGGIESILFSRPASAATATIGVQLELPPLSEDDQAQRFEFVITNRIKALSSVNAGLN